MQFGGFERFGFILFRAVQTVSNCVITEEVWSFNYIQEIRTIRPVENKILLFIFSDFF